MYKNCREELLAVMRAFVIETGENEFSRRRIWKNRLRLMFF